MTAARFVVGIDLGTTHTVVAYAAIDPKRKGAPEPRIFEIAQLTTAREREALALLPSALYAPLPGEVDGDPEWVAGELARKGLEFLQRRGQVRQRKARQRINSHRVWEFVSGRLRVRCHQILRG